MPRRGPPPKPTVLKIGAGTVTDEEARAEPIPDVGTIDPPDRLTEDELLVWEALAPTVIAMGTLTIADIEPFAQLCEVLVIRSKAKAFIDQHGTAYPIYHTNADGTIAVDKEGNPKVKTVQTFPQVTTFRQMTDLGLRIMTHYGMTAASRTKIMIDDPKHPNPLAVMRERHRQQAKQHSRTA